MYRSRLPANRQLLEEVLIRLSQLVTDLPEIAELDINPLSVDARVVVKPAPCPAPLHLVVSPYLTQYESKVNVEEVGDLLIRTIRPEDTHLLVVLFCIRESEDLSAFATGNVFQVEKNGHSIDILKETIQSILSGAESIGRFS